MGKRVGGCEKGEESIGNCSGEGEGEGDSTSFHSAAPRKCSRSPSLGGGERLNAKEGTSIRIPVRSFAGRDVGRTSLYKFKYTNVCE